MDDFRLIIEAAIAKAKSDANIKKYVEEAQKKVDDLKLNIKVTDSNVKSAIKEINKELQKGENLARNAYKLDDGKLQTFNKIGSYISNNTKLTKEQVSSLKELQNGLVGVKDKSGLDQIKTKFRTITSEAERLGTVGDTVFSRLGKNTLQFLNYLGSATVIMTAINGIKNLTSTVIEMDEAITNIRMVIGGSIEDTQKLINSYGELAQQLGATTTDVVASANEFLRMGKTVSETNTLITNSMVLSKDAQLDSSSSTKYLTSAMLGYKVAVEDTIGIVDMLTAVDMESATSAGGLAEGMSRTAASANLAGVEMEKLIGYLATVGEVTQKDMTSIGESFKTIFARMGNVKLGKFVDEDGNDITTEINDVEKVLNKVDIKLRTSATEFRDFGDVLDEVGNNWNKFNEIEKSAIATTFAGVRQRENLLVLFDNYSNSLKYTETAANSAGTAMEKFSFYQESASAKTDRLVSSLQELAMDTLDSGFIKGLLDTSNVVVQLVDNIGLFNVALVALSAVVGSKTTLGMNLFQGVIEKSILKMGVATATAETLSMALSTMIPTAAILLGTKLLSELVDWIIVTKEEQAELVEQSKQNIEALSSEVSSLNTELVETNSRIRELQGQDKLTFLESNELSNLIATREELERITAAKQAALDIDNAKYAKEAEKLYDKTYGDFNVYNPQMVEDAKLTNNSFLPSTDDINAVIAYYDQISEAKDNAFDSKTIEMYEGLLKDSKFALTEWANSATDVYQNLLLIDEANRTDSQKQKIDNLAKSLDYINSLLDDTYVATQKTNKFNDIFNAESFSRAKEQLQSLAKAGTLTPETISTNKEYQKLLQDTGLSAQDAIKQIYALVAASQETGTTSVTALQSYKDIIDSVSKNIKMVTEAQYELSDSGYLNYDTVSSLLEVYPELEKSLTATSSGYVVAKGALDDLIESESAKYELELSDAITAGENLLGQQALEAGAYDNTKNSLIQLTKARIADLQAQISAYNFMQNQVLGKQYLTPKFITDAQSELKGLQGSLENILNADTNSKNAKSIIDQIKNQTNTDLTEKDKKEKPAWLTTYETSKSDLDHQLAMDEITQSEYYDKLNKLNESVYSAHKKDFFDTYRQNQEDIYKGRKQIDEKLLDQALKDKKKSLEDSADATDRILSLYDNSQSQSKNIGDSYSDGSDEQIKAYSDGLASVNQEISYINKQIAKLNKMKVDGLFKDNEDEYVNQLKTLQDALYDTTSTAKTFTDAMADSVKSQQEDITDAFNNSFETEKKNLENLKNSYDEIIDAQKEILDLKEKQRDYENAIAKQTKEISTIESRMAELQLAANSGDRQASAELRKLDEERAKKKDDLAEDQHDHEVDLQQTALDKAKDDYDKLHEDKMNALEAEHKKQIDDINDIYNNIISLISNSANYLDTEFGTKLQGYLSQLNSFGIVPSDEFVNGIKGGQAQFNTKEQALSILQNGNGTGKGTSELNSYVKSNFGGKQLSYEQMAQLASIFGFGGVTAENIKNDTITKNMILEALKRLFSNSTMVTGGVVKVGSSSGSGLLSDLLKSLGEDRFMAVRDKEGLMSQQDTKVFRYDFIPTMNKFMTAFKPTLPDMSNIVTNNNSSSPTIQINLPANTTIDNSAINNYRKFIPELTDAVSERLIDISKQFR